MAAPGPDGTPPGASEAPRLRALLAAAPPAVSVNDALRLLIVTLRAQRKAGAAVDAPGRAALDRLLDGPPRPDLPAEAVPQIKAGLFRLVRHGAEAEAAAIWAALQAAGPAPAAGPVEVWVEALPPGMNAPTLAGLLGVDPGALLHAPGPAVGRRDITALHGQDLAPGSWGAALAPAAAAVALHQLAGLDLGGVPLRLRAALDPGARLPAVPREQRADKGRWGRAGPWLPTVDALSRRSLTPEALAARQAAVARELVGAGGLVIDAFAGVGGNAVAFAAAGLRVRGLERDPARAAAADAALRARGAGARGRVEAADADARAPALLAAHPGALLFLDPPWEPEDDGRGVDLEALLSPTPRLFAAARAHPRLLLKLPRTFALDRLPPGPWRVAYERGSPETGDAAVIRLLTLSRGSPPAAPVEQPRPGAG